MVKSTSMTTLLAMVCLSFQAWAASPPTSQGISPESSRSRLKAVDRSDSKTTRRLPVPSTADNRLSGLHRHSGNSRVSESPRQENHRIPLKSATGIDLRGTVLSSNAWTTPAYGLYTIPTTSGVELTPIGLTQVPLTQGWDNGSGTYYSTYLVTDYSGYYVESCHLTAFDTSDWSMLYDEELPDFSMYAFGAAEDPTTGEVYACCANATYNGYDWVKIDYAAKKVDVIYKEIPIYFAAVGCDNKGQFYGVTELGNFVKIDKTTGEYTKYPSDPMFPSDVYASTQHGACVDDANGRFLVATWDYMGQTSALHSFDITDGTYTRLIDFPHGEQVLGLYIPAAPASPLAPAAPGFSVTCENGAMEVIAKLSLPTTLLDGSDATGQTFGYSISVNGQTEKEGTATAGAELDIPLQMTISGIVNFTAILSNQHGDSPKSRASCYVGKGAPSSPANISLIWSDNTATLTWDAVTTSSDGGYLDPAAVTYTIRDIDGETIKSGLTATSATFTVEAPASGVAPLAYSVAAVYDSKASAFVPSNTIMLGSYEVPLEMAFDDETFPQHTIIDGNGDGNVWMLNFGKAMMTYNFEMAMDDWLISPPLSLEANKTYPFTARVCATQATYPERIEVMAGTSPTVEAMTIAVVAPTTIADASYEGMEISGNITTDQAGDYHIGLHGISDKGMYNLFILSYQIGTSLSGDNPAAVDDLTVTPDQTGALSAGVSFTAPTKNVGGQTLTGNLSVVVTRDGTAEIYNREVAPGAPVSFTDNLPEAGEYTYTVTAANGDAVSAPTSVSAYIGPKPAALVDKVAAWQAAPDKVQLTWAAVTTDIDGDPIAASDVTYEVYAVNVNAYNKLELGDKITTAPISATSYMAARTPAEEQDYAYFAVKSLHKGVGATELTVGSALFGTPYPTPHRISGKDIIDGYFFEGWTSDQYASINLGSSANGVPAQDGDDSYIIVKTPYYDQSAHFITGNISLSGTTSPTLIFWIYGFENPSGDLNETEISVIADGEEEIVETIRHAYLTTNRWNRQSIDLADYSGKDIRVKIATYCHGTQFSLYDNIYIGQNITRDLAATLDAPAKVVSGTPFTTNVTVRNDGAEDVTQFDVKLLRYGEEVATRTITTPLPAEATTVVTFDQILGIHDSSEVVYTAEVVCAADEYADNDKSAPVEVSRIINDGPTVASLTGEKTAQGNRLTWTPVSTGISIPETISEGFEESKSWQHETDGWTFIDADESPVGGFTSVDIPGITPSTTCASFFVWDYTLAGNGDSRFMPHGGDKFIASLYRSDYGQSDDWAISPLLAGEAQAVTFYAKSYSGSYPERIEILYTTQDAADITAYTKIENVGGTVPGEWTSYTFDLPEGATHFAVRSTAVGAYMLMLDDFTFKADKGFYGQLIGYNVYCDRQLLNDAPLTETAYTHVNPGETHTYHVSAVYDSGESELSQPLVLSSSNIADIQAAAVSITVDGRVVTVTGAASMPVTLSGIDGRKYHSGNGDCRLTVAPGTYILSVGQSARKLIVR